MNKYIFGIIGAGVLAVTAGCSKDLPFDGPELETGSVSRSALDVTVNTTEYLVRSANVDVNDVMVSFIPEGKTEPYVTYRYGDMSEIVTLPVGVYTAEATYGENESAAWDAPYYAGVSSKFNVVADRVTTDIEPIVCTLSNVKVSIVFDTALAAVMSGDAKVSVSVGESGNLDFMKADSERQGYFRFDANTDPDAKNTLAATFSGLVEGSAVSETKTYDNVAPGNYYRITFRLHAHEPSTGGASAGVTVDATVETVDKDGNVNPDDELLVDDSRPNEGEEPGPGPVTPPVTGEGPEATLSEGLSLTEVNNITDGMECVLHVASETGLTVFTVDIVSPTLTPEELENVGLKSHLDLVSPGDLEEALAGLGFPVNVGGEKECDFVLTDFLPLLGALGPGDHTFKMTIADASGTNIVNLRFRTL